MRAFDGMPDTVSACEWFRCVNGLIGGGGAGATLLLIAEALMCTGRFFNLISPLPPCCRIIFHHLFIHIISSPQNRYHGIQHQHHRSNKQQKTIRQQHALHSRTANLAVVFHGKKMNTWRRKGGGRAFLINPAPGQASLTSVRLPTHPH